MSWGTWSHSGTRCKIKPKWFDAGKEGEAFGFFDDNKGQEWIVVHWDSEDDPDLHKASGLLIKRLGDKLWESF